MTTMRRFMFVILAMLVAAGGAETALAAPQQMQITLAGYTNRTEVLTNFPVLVTLSNNVGSGFTFANFVTTNGTDLRFATNNTSTNWLNYEIESWNTNAGQASYIWVQVPTIPVDGSGTIWANWGDTANSNQLVCTTNGYAWTTDYLGVYHLSNLTNDSTRNVRHGAINGTVPSTNGRLGGGAGFTNNANNYIQLGTNLQLTGNYTISAWVPSPTLNSNNVTQVYVGRQGSGTIRDYLCGAGGNGTNGAFFVQRSNGTYPSAASPSSYTNNVWYHIVSIYDSSKLYTYVNGSLKATSNTTLTVTSDFGRDTRIGRINNVGSSYPWNGTIDEVRLSNLATSSNWVWASYVNMASNMLFNNYGAMQSAVSGGPAIQNQPATSVTTNSAMFNGYLSSTGTSATTVYVLWGPTDCGANGGPTYWANTNTWPAPQAPGSFTANVTGLASNTVYYYRFAASNTAGMVWADPAVVFMTGPVTVQATTPNAAEHGLVPGVFTISRPSSCTGFPLTVNYTLAGTATMGVDYANLTGIVNFQAADTNALVTVTPLPGGAVSGPVTVILSLTPSTYYAVGTPNTDVVTIAAAQAWYVAPPAAGSDANAGTSWAAPFATISNALNWAQNGDLILVSNGTYNITAELFVTNAVTLRSVSNASSTMVLRTSGAIRVMTVGNPWAVVDGFTLRNNNAISPSGGGAYMTAGTIRNCIITNNSIANSCQGGGIYMTGGLLQNCTVVKNVADSATTMYGGGIYLTGNGIVDRCVVAYNYSAAGGQNGNNPGGGVYMAGADSRIAWCTVTMRGVPVRVVASPCRAGPCTTAPSCGTARTAHREASAWVAGGSPIALSGIMWRTPRSPMTSATAR